MSKPIPPAGIVRRSPTDQVKYFADAYRALLQRDALTRAQSNAEKFGLRFSEDELFVIAALDHPDKVQGFLNTQLYYNNDHASIELEETAMPPRRVLQTGLAHCFEGALFAYAVNFLHDYHPQLVLLEASQDSEHNLVVWRDARTGLYGCNAHSRYPGLDGRRAEFASIRAMAESYVPHYYSDRTNDPSDLTLVGYSDAFDLRKFGVAWMASEEPLWDIYYTYIDDTVRFHFFDANANEWHWYPVIRALKKRWIDIDALGKPFVNADNLPRDAQVWWHTFWKLHGDNQTYRRPRGEEAEIEKRFLHLTGTTPIDLDDNAFDFQFYLDAGYRVEQLLTLP